MRFEPLNPYNELPLLPPKENIETSAILRKDGYCWKGDGRTEGTWRAIPNQAMLINTIVLQEAQSSSEIENIITTTDTVVQRR